MNKNQIRLALDVFLSITMVLAMLYQFTGNMLHEIAGVVFVVAIILHLALSMRWARATANTVKKGRKLTRSTKISIFMGVALLIATVIMAITSILISQQLPQLGIMAFYLMDVTAYNTVAVIHTGASYAICVLTVVHLALHWRFIVSTWHIPYDPSRRRAIGTTVAGVAALGCVAVASTGAGTIAEKLAFLAESANPETASATEAQSSDTTENTPSINDKQQDTTPYSQYPAPEQQERPKKNKGMHSDQYGDSSNQQQVPSTPSTPDSGGSNSSTPGDSSSSSGSGSGSSSDLSSQICTLCPKRCPLSSPRCDRPYIAGLL